MKFVMNSLIAIVHFFLLRVTLLQKQVNIFSFESLSKQINIPNIQVSNKNNINKCFSTNINYNQWHYFLTEAYQYDFNESKRIIYMQEIQNENIFLQNMKTLGVSCQLLNIEEISNDNFIEPISIEIFQKINIEQQIKNSIKLKNSPPSKNNSYILMIHYEASFLDSIQMGNFQKPVKQLFYGIFKKDYQKWYTFNATQGQLPDDQLLGNVKAIIMSGSPSSAYSDKDWIIQYRKWIQNVYQNLKQVRILGICFGEQIVAHSLNGKCEYAKGKYNTGTQKILMKDIFFEVPFVKKLNLKEKYFYITKSHGDIVCQIDNSEFEVVGSSEKYFVEIYISKLKDVTKNPRIFCIQGHPEYSSEWTIMKEAQNSFKVYNIEFDKAIQNARQNYLIPDNSLEIRAICDSFLLY